MTRRFILCLALALFGFTASGAEQDLYNPLAIGLRWDLDVEMTPAGGQPVHGSAVREITGTQKIGPYTYFVVTTTFTDIPKMTTYTMYRRKTAHAIYAINALDKDKLEHLEAVLPLIVGQSWKTTIGFENFTSTVEAKESVKIDDKAYEDCMKISYKSGSGNLSGTFYQAPDVGNIQETTATPGAAFKFTLKKFSGLK